MGIDIDFAKKISTNMGKMYEGRIKDLVEEMKLLEKGGYKNGWVPFQLEPCINRNLTISRLFPDFNLCTDAEKDKLLYMMYHTANIDILLDGIDMEINETAANTSHTDN